METKNVQYIFKPVHATAVRLYYTALPEQPLEILRQIILANAELENSPQ